MSQRKIVIRKERPPARCEVCHQSDRFDRGSGKCLRCDHITSKYEPVSQPKFFLAVAGMVITLSISLSFLYLTIYPETFIDNAPTAWLDWVVSNIDKSSNSGQIIYNIALKIQLRRYFVMACIWMLVVTIFQFNIFISNYLEIQKKK